MATTRRGSGRRHRTKPDPYARRVGQRIRKLRREHGFTFDAFVEETGLGRGYVSELERGLVVPTISTLAKVATTFEISVSDLVRGDTLREQLFEELRGASAADIERVRAYLHSIRKSPDEPPVLRAADRRGGESARGAKPPARRKRPKRS